MRLSTTHPDEIPLLPQEKRLSRSKVGNDIWGEFSRKVYSKGYDDPENPGSASTAGGQEQPLSIESVKNFATKLEILLKNDDVFKIKWVRRSFVKSIQ